MRTVGILGGMGPEATVALMTRIIAATPAQDDADHVPLIVDQNSQVPSRVAHLIEGTGADPSPVLADMARRLQGAGAEALAMPCNTAHHYADAIRGAADIPFLDMIALTVDEARRAGADTVAILGSPAIEKAHVFTAALAARGMTAEYPTDREALLHALRLVKSKGPTATARAMLCAASESITAQVQLVACTEFSLIADTLPPQITRIDTLDVLARAVVAFGTES